ncbi:ATP-dependent DNA helicase II subunit 1 [Cladophialophora chaetospira]|uniref:ATP-dependent DNA helicase II subunit 1 n=1 Tax=Cladophialophora chaetospira TaxID=386627 RepID=A0AA39CJQ9_9EURO|nr:ATP-dependent DNA helicase II subunit 1 [Cladophialophora chaetospira]
MGDRLPYRSKDNPDEAGRNEDDEDEEDIDETGYKTVKDAVLFAIEVNKSMLKVPRSSSGSKKTDTTSPLLAALKCAYHLMQQRIISTPKDLMGIMLYGTEASKFYDEDESLKGGYSFPNCYLLTDLDVPEAGDVKALKEIVEAKDPESNDLFKPAKDPISMHNVLFCANQIFQQKASNFTSRRLFIVTDSDDPHTSNKESRTQATVRAKDLYDLGVTIELFPISTAEHVFDTKLFWDDIVYRSSPTDPEAIIYNPTSIVDSGSSKLVSGGEGITLLQSLLSNIQSKVAPKRALFSSVPLELGPDFRISVKGFLLYKHQKPARSSYIYLGGEKPAIVTGFTEQVAEDEYNTRPVEKAEVRKAYTFGGEKVTFSTAEAQKLRDWGEPIIRVVGFKPMSKLPMWANIKNSTFLYPSEEDVVGSTRVYSALHRKLSKDQLFALTWFVPRKNAVPVMAAMLPTLSAESSEEKPNEAAVSATGAPQGLHLIPLPFADDIRQNPPLTHQEPVRAPDELVDAMRPIIQQLNLPKGIYDPSKYPNPSLQWHYRILQALALDDEIPEKPDDKTIPKYRQIDKRVGVETTEWGKALEQAFRKYLEENPDAASTGAKRPPPSNGAAYHSTKDGPGKKVKLEDVRTAMNEVEIRQMWQKGSLSKLTVAQLKDFAAMKKITVSGKKADILEQIEAWLEIVLHFTRTFVRKFAQVKMNPDRSPRELPEQAKSLQSSARSKARGTTTWSAAQVNETATYIMKAANATKTVSIRSIHKIVQSYQNGDRLKDPKTAIKLKADIGELIAEISQTQTWMSEYDGEPGTLCDKTERLDAGRKRLEARWQSLTETMEHIESQSKPLKDLPSAVTPKPEIKWKEAAVSAFEVFCTVLATREDMNRAMREICDYAQAVVKANELLEETTKRYEGFEPARRRKELISVLLSLEKEESI